MEVTGGVLGNKALTALPVVEIIPGEAYEFFDYTAKYTPGATSEICPARLDDRLTRKVQECAKLAHQALYCNDYSRTDMIVDGDDIYVLETNTIPGMTPTSLFPLAAKTAGISFGQLLDQLINLSLERTGRNK
jgi:D-alanine-D-alanine ligase